MSVSAPADTDRQVYTPAGLNREARALLEGAFPLIWVEGEISNLARPRSGHMYFSLKDANAQVRCALFRGRARALRFEPEDGLAVLLRARVSLYEARGEFQLIVEHMEPAGEGALRREFERLRLKLESEGLFAEAGKRALPRFPRRIGVVTSATGAAIRDVLTVLRRRFPAVPVRVYPVPVQGEAAAPAIVRALARAGERKDCDVLILTRGGGSLEDLWAFNEEVVVRAVRACAVPLICAVGHEVDVTLSDLAADVRAATPSAAAELAVPDQQSVGVQFQQHGRRLSGHLQRRLRELTQSTDWIAHRLQRVHPGRRLVEHREKLDGLARRQSLAATGLLGDRRRRLGNAAARLMASSPRRRLERERRTLATHRGRLVQAASARFHRLRGRYLGVRRALAAVGPQATLDRGYAVLRHASDGTVIRDPREAPAGTRLEALLARGRLLTRVESDSGGPEEESGS